MKGSIVYMRKVKPLNIISGVLIFALIIWLALLSEGEKVTSKIITQENEDLTIQEYEVEEQNNINTTYFIDDTQIRNMLHDMTHEIVKSHEKNEFLENAGEQISMLLEILETEPVERKEFYMDILNAWKNGNFSNVVFVHDSLTDCRAEYPNECLTPEEEEFIQDAKERGFIDGY